jgi:hypothetical protein
MTVTMANEKSNPSVRVLVGTWRDGLHVVSGEARHQELAGQSVRSLASDGRGGAIAIVGGHSLCRRTEDGEWRTVISGDFDLACAVAVGNDIYVGTDDARMLRVDPEGKTGQLSGFDSVEGRQSWFAGSAVIDGRVVGPPLGIRSIAATCDGRTLLANVHVGGIPRSIDGGVTWRPTIDIESDVHEVRAHPTRPDIVIAAAAIGLYISRDAGESWSVEREGLHTTYCSAVAFSGNDMLVSASTDHFADEGAVYRRSIDGNGPLVSLGAGFPIRIGGIADTGCIASCASIIAVADKSGHLYVSVDAGTAWSLFADGLPAPSSLLIV